MWTPVVGETLLLKREPTNLKDQYAVAVYKDATVVGHIPYNHAPQFSQFLLRDVKAFAEATGQKVNRGAGYGLEVPCLYRLYGPKAYIDKIKDLIDSLRSAGFV